MDEVVCETEATRVDVGQNQAARSRGSDSDDGDEVVGEQVNNVTLEQKGSGVEGIVVERDKRAKSREWLAYGRVEQREAAREAGTQG